jgi:asparaginyl-tRNA synthetase
VRLPYTEGINILQEAIKNGKKFEFPCNWGDDLASEHERYLVEEHFKKPVIMTDYPAAIKSFYMKQNNPAPAGSQSNGGAEGSLCSGGAAVPSVGYRGTVAPGPTMQGTDVLFPQIGEIIGGSVREENYDKLMAEINRRQMDLTHLWWYLDTRRYGSCPHAGFGLGFERLILFVTGMQNIRDVIPFPRTPKSAEF